MPWARNLAFRGSGKLGISQARGNMCLLWLDPQSVLESIASLFWFLLAAQ